MDRRWVGYHVFPSRVFVSHSTEHFPRGTLVFQKCYGVEFFWIIEVSRFSLFFCLRLPKKFVEEPFCVSECFCYRKTLCLRGEYHDFVSKSCCLTVPKKNCWNNSVYWKTSGIEKTFCKGGSWFSVDIFLSHTTETLRRGNLLGFRNFLV